jgi:membrane associated rhomboid family serine protease
MIPAFVVANVIMFIITMYVNNCPKNSVSCVADFLKRFSFQPFKENPLLGPSSTTLVKMGALDVGRVVDNHQGWRLISCIWLHGGLFHLLANMLSLVVIGIRLEQEFGFVRIGLLYLISGFGGSLLSALFIQTNISVGASGAVFGLLGAMLSELITNWTIYVNKVMTLVTLVIIIAINLAVGILPHVDNFAHLGGFISGFLIGFVFLIRPQFGWVNQRYASLSNSASLPAPRRKFKTYQCVLWIISLVLLVSGLVVGLVLLLRGVDLNDHCSWCHYMSCVPTSRWSCNTQPISCMTEQTGNQLNLSCSNNNKTGTYMLANATASQIQGLCSQLCT